MRWLLLMLLPASLSAVAAVPGFDGGHVKARMLVVNYPGDSAFRASSGEWAGDQGADLRLKFATRANRFSFKADYQLQAQFGDSLEIPGAASGLFLTTPAVPDDDRRWWDLTHTISDNDDRAVVQRLDRLYLDYSGDRVVARFGRQAVTWGNGLIYTPMDFFNPFDPAAVDTEYKLGDDMLYGQYLLDGGSDWQFVHVQRRDEDGDLDSSVSSTAIKFHGFGVDREFDLLVADHYDQWVLGAGGLANLGGAVLRGDVTLTDGRDGWETSLVTNWSWSWVWGGYNVSAVTEYFYSGFGLKESDYSPDRFREDRDLVERLARGELFTIGRHYLAGSLLVELTPLVNLTPNLFVNVDDGSALMQLVLQWDPDQDWQLLGSLAVPVGSSNTEFGGLQTGVDDLTLEVGPSLFLQLGWYF